MRWHHFDAWTYAWESLQVHCVRDIRRCRKRSFLWGAATAGHQVEGNLVNDDCWLLENLPHSMFKEPSGDACDQYHLFESDIAMLASFGMNAYRFSVEWSRIEPVEGAFSRAELGTIDECLRHATNTA